jgi:Major Facilitator Superfamily
VPESADPGAPRLDRSGAALSVLALVAIVYSIIQAPTAGWLSGQTLTGLGLGLVLLAGFICCELRQHSPMLDPRLFTQRILGAGSLSIFVQFFAFYGFVFLILQYLQIVRGNSALIAAVSMLPMAATMLPTARLAPTLAAKFGARRTCTAGLLLIAVIAQVSQVSQTSPYWLLAVGLLVLGVGLGAAMTPATSNITTALPPAQQGVASAINDLSREVGGAIGIAVIGSIMTAIYRAHLTVPGVPAAILGHAKDSVAVASHIGGPVAAKADTAFIDGVHIALDTAAGAAVLAAVAVFLMLSRPASTPPTGTGHQADEQAAPRPKSWPDRNDGHALGCSTVLHGSQRRKPWSTTRPAKLAGPRPAGKRSPGARHDAQISRLHRPLEQRRTAATNDRATQTTRTAGPSGPPALAGAAPHMGVLGMRRRTGTPGRTPLPVPDPERPRSSDPPDDRRPHPRHHRRPAAHGVDISAEFVPVRDGCLIHGHGGLHVSAVPANHRGRGPHWMGSVPTRLTRAVTVVLLSAFLITNRLSARAQVRWLPVLLTILAIAWVPSWSLTRPW